MPRPKFPSDEYRYSISFPPGMRDWIKQEARANHRSMNAEIIYRLEKSLTQDKKPYGESL
jgi:hypothetical protein